MYKKLLKPPILYIGMVLAAGLGVYGQDIAYFLNRSLSVPLMVSLSLTTILSLFLFFTPIFLILRLGKKNQLEKKDFIIYLGINTFLAINISAFSIFVLIAWFG